MKLKDKLLEIKEILSYSEKEYEEEKDFNYAKKRGIISEDKIYRFHYLEFSGYVFRELKNFTCKDFILPKSFTLEESFKIISYVFEHSTSEPGSYACCCKTTYILNLLGFDLVDSNIFNKVDLYCVASSDNGKMFENTVYADEYFEWFIENVTKEDIEEIYSSKGLIFPDIHDLYKKEKVKKRKLDNVIDFNEYKRKLNR